MSITLEVVEGPQCGRQFTFDGHDNFIVGRATCAHFRLPRDEWSMWTGATLNAS